MSKDEVQQGILCPECGVFIINPETHEHFDVAEPETKDDEPEVE